MRNLFSIILIIVFLLSGCNISANNNITNSLSNKDDVIVNKNVFYIKGDNFLYEGPCSAYILLNSESLREGKLVSVDIDINNDTELETFLIRRDSPNGIDIIGVKGKYGFGFGDFDFISAFDEFGELKSGYTIQLTCYDFRSRWSR